MRVSTVFDIMTDLEEQKPSRIIIETSHREYTFNMCDGSFDVDIQKELLLLTDDNGTKWIDTSRIECIRV